ncbi:response regulator receiver protein [Solidesulfovibrio carbinoliphilus subsp. oakridgensis]|uniref:Response regulator receiver protein n=1 Tax=Solidesulfovibrio carbinoliphilus subsp. oakridgensis TaxID=694327 RepID=G7Q9R6_9BACT|nr:response regulator [Solidesulfovibrio carbinoliphilus]EHJ49182.1 response regulator receiver protein [Solidesulfovibrio carbinoliphilus subsp. oakridgensis]
MKTVLVVDDDPSIRALIRLYLEGAGYAVIEAADGRLAMSALAGQPVDLVVLDIFMPEMDGLEVLQVLRDQCQSCKVMAISGGSAKIGLDLLDHATIFGADAVLEKPFGAARLLEKTAALIGTAAG